MNQSVMVRKRQKSDSMYFRNAEVLSYNVKYPSFYSSMARNGLRRINHYYERQAYEFLDYIRGELYNNAVEDYINHEGEFFPYQAEQNFVVTYNKNCALSLYLDRYEFSGGAHGNTVRSSKTWNIRNGRQYHLEDFFRVPNITHYILRNIINQIEKQIAEGGNINYFDNYRQLAVEYFDVNNFYLTNRGVVIYYQLYTIAPYVDGIVQFLIPYDRNRVKEPSCR